VNRSEQVRWRSLLYVPGHNRKLLDGAHRRGADALILDLEDGVPASAKEEARANLAAAVPALRAGGAAVLVRINRPWRLAWRDLEAAVAAGAAAVVLPKVESAAQVRVIAEHLAEVEADASSSPLGLIATVESAAGLLRAGEIAAASPRLRALIPGNEDLALSLGVPAEPEAMLHAAWQLLVAARAAGIALLGTIGGSAGYRDLDGYRRATTLAAERGFEGATCIHPDQVRVANEVFRPSAERVAEAREVVAAFEAGNGEPVGVAGRMVDRPVYLRAKRVLELAEGSGL
jgi:citrate lyase subunit beta/citryl-CoA lyase